MCALPDCQNMKRNPSLERADGNQGQPSVFPVCPLCTRTLCSQMKTILGENLNSAALSSPPSAAAFLCTLFPLPLNNSVGLPLSTGPHYSAGEGGLTSWVPSPTSLPDANERGTRV